jgi:SPP1 family predicted phage head-tail adaptor
MNLDRKIEIQSITPVKNNFGEEAITWTHFAYAWASVNYKGGREGFYARQVVATGEVVFKIRYIAGITETMKIIYDGKKFDIRNIAESGRRDMLEITATSHDNE